MQSRSCVHKLATLPCLSIQCRRSRRCDKTKMRSQASWSSSLRIRGGQAKCARHGKYIYIYKRSRARLRHWRCCCVGAHRVYVSQLLSPCLRKGQMPVKQPFLFPEKKKKQNKQKLFPSSQINKRVPGCSSVAQFFRSNLP